MKSGKPVQAVATLGNPVGSSHLKREFFNYADEQCSDDEINYLGSVIHFMKNENFKTELQQLITKYGSTNYIYFTFNFFI